MLTNAWYARQVVSAGYKAVVDATFLKHEQREPFLRLAREENCPLLILSIQAPDQILRERIRQRNLAAKDPSEATESVLEHQIATEEPLTDAEKKYSLSINSSDQVPIDRIVPGCIQALG